MSTPHHWLAAPGDYDPIFPFISLRGRLSPSMQTHVRESRAGVNGIGLWYTSRRGMPFSVSTVCDYITVQQALSVFNQYRDRVGQQMQLWYSLQNWGPVVVHSVSLNECRAASAIVGGIFVSGSSGALLNATWTLETLHE